MNEDRFDEQRFEYGEKVRVTRNVRNDGTYPGMKTGNLLIRRGSIGHVIEMGTFLQDQVIYTVHFLDQGRMVGCRAEELIPADAPWIPSQFEFRDRVTCKNTLAVQGEIKVEQGHEGEVIKVVREHNPPHYHVRFPGITLQVPETGLAPVDTAASETEETS